MRLYTRNQSNHNRKHRRFIYESISPNYLICEMDHIALHIFVFCLAGCTAFKEVPYHYKNADDSLEAFHAFLLPHTN